jgi:hypothetical protein
MAGTANIKHAAAANKTFFIPLSSFFGVPWGMISVGTDSKN